MKTQNELLIDMFFTYMKQKNKRLIGKLNGGITITEIDAILEPFPFLVSDEVKYFFTKANGYKPQSNLNIGQSLLFEFGMLMPLSKCLLEYGHLKNIQMELVGKFPLFDSGGGDFLLIDCQRQSPTYNQILIWSPALLIIEPVVIYNSLVALLSTAIRCHMVGAYRYNSNFELEIDYDKQLTEGKYVNPRVSYWINA